MLGDAGTRVPGFSALRLRELPARELQTSVRFLRTAFFKKVAATYPDGTKADWLPGAAYIFKSLAMVSRFEKAWKVLEAHLALRHGRRRGGLEWYDVLHILVDTIREAGSLTPTCAGVSGIPVLKFNTMPTHLIEPDFWIELLVEEGMSDRSLGFFRACSAACEVDAEAGTAYRNILKVARPLKGRRKSLGGEEHIKMFLQVGRCALVVIRICLYLLVTPLSGEVAFAARHATGDISMLPKLVRDRAVELGVETPEALGCATWGEVGCALCRLGSLQMAELERLQDLAPEPRSRNGTMTTPSDLLGLPGVVLHMPRATPMASPAPMPEVGQVPRRWLNRGMSQRRIKT